MQLLFSANVLRLVQARTALSQLLIDAYMGVQLKGPTDDKMQK